VESSVARRAGSFLNTYETGKLLAEYLLFHYGSEEAVCGALPVPREACDFAVRCVDELVDAAALPSGARALDLGCSVGRSSFELSRFCQDVLGIDLSQSFVRAAKVLQEKGNLSFKVVLEGDLCEPMQARVPESLDRGRVRFQTGDAMSLSRDLGTFDLLLAANLICRLPAPKRFLQQVSQFLNRGGQLLLTTPFTWLEEFTPRVEWLGGHREERLRSSETLRRILEPNFELQLTRDLPFLIREHERKFQYGVALGWRWVRR
jgi:putative 4-mercaptohistidine N1-methyltranferase